MPSIIKELPARQGQALSNRYLVRRFKSYDAMHRFLNKQGNEWKIMKEELPSGTYFTQLSRDGLRYINTKELTR